MKIKSDSKFKAKRRNLQDYYRSNILKVQCGTGPDRNSTHFLGNCIVDGDKSGFNFLNEYLFRYAKQKVKDKQISSDLTIDKFRLFNNLLSSMPMAFNLFGLFRKILKDNQAVVAQIGRRVFFNRLDSEYFLY